MVLSIMKVLYAVLFAAALLSNANGQGNGAVRLNNDGNTDISNIYGVAEVYYNSRWGPICITDSSYGHIGVVVCHQLGFDGGSSGSVSHNKLTTRPVLSNVKCTKDLLVILQCEYDASESTLSSCQPFDNVEVYCTAARIWDNPYNGMVRLQGGYYSGQGIVEIYCNKIWTTVCNDHQVFKGETADVVCTQLGYNQHDSNLTKATPFKGSVYLHDVDCDREASSKCLSECDGGSCSDSLVTCTSYGVNVTCIYNTQISDEGSTINTCKNSGLSGGAIAGIVIAALFFVACLCCCCVCCCCHIFRNKDERDPEKKSLNVKKNENEANIND